VKPVLVLLTIALAFQVALSQDNPVTPSSVPLVSATGIAATLSSDQLRELIRRVAESDIENDKKQLNYTYIERVEEHRLDGKGQVKSTEIRTREIMVLYGGQVERLIAKNDKPLPEKDAKDEEERIQKLSDRRKNETDKQRAKRIVQEEKDREETRQFVSEIVDAYNFRLVGMEILEGRKGSVATSDGVTGIGRRENR
jgi:hypothetical protein